MDLADRLRKEVADIGRKYPDAWKQADSFRAEREQINGGWPDWCFLPIAGWMAITMPHRKSMLEALAHLDKAFDSGILAALGAWRVTQGIYRFDETFLKELVRSDFDGNIPSDILTRLPEWCVYIETPGDSLPYDGFFAHLEYETDTKSHELRIVFDGNGSFTPLPVLLGDWTVEEAMERLDKSAESRMRAAGIPANICRVEDRAFVGTAELLKPAISICLYLCSVNADIGGGAVPERPRPTKTKKGPRYFPADKPRTWDVGWRIGSALRKAEAMEVQEVADGSAEGVRHRPRPHVRRAHYHTFLMGPRTGKQERFVKWLPPKGINLDLGDIVPTVHPVHGAQEASQQGEL